MKNIIVGTAGHIDHGKTSLIRALTGRDTDRLKEEKERGISIELGFTYFDLPSGRRAGIIDVPGHEKFIKNMLAGAGGIDIVVLVIAADEGVMPQTKEHLNILKLLQIKNGIIALTKKDMVDEEWLEMITEQIRDEVSDTFLKDSPIIPVSSVKGEGVDVLIKEIDRMTEVTEAKCTNTVFRMPIDRVFTISGFGTVVTGTMISGSIQEGDRVEIYPQGIEARIRSIQVHEKGVKAAYAGQRVAINIANVKVEDIERGNLLAKPGSMDSTMMIDARLEMLQDAEKSIDNRDRLRLYQGTAEIMCRVVLLDREELKPGESAFVQLRLEETIACQKGDRFVIRFYSPMITIGGGTVLDPNPPKRKRFKEEVIEELKVKEKGNPADLVEQYLILNSDKFPERKQVNKMTLNVEPSVFDGYVEELKGENRIHEFKLGAESYLLHHQYLSSLEEKLAANLEAFHKKNPLKAGISKEELKSKLFEGLKQKLSDALFSYYEHLGVIKLLNHYVSQKDFFIEFSSVQLKIKDNLLKFFKEGGFNPPKPSELVNVLGYDKNQISMVISALIDMGELVKLEEDILFHKDSYGDALEILKKHLIENKSIVLGQFRDLLGTSRKYAMALLDYFDQNKITKRIEDKRVLF